MISIESNTIDKQRIEFNKPYSCINLQWGYTYDVLPNLDWTGKKIVWLDYDGSLQNYMFDDVETIFSNLEEDSFYMMSCNATFQKYVNKTEINFDAFNQDFQENAPFDLKPKSLMSSKESPNLIRTMLLNKIKQTLDDKNATISKTHEKLIFIELINLRYKDGAPMFSFGGVITKKKNASKFKHRKLPYISYRVKGLLNIETPILTNPEIVLMNKYLPKSKKRFLSLKALNFIPKDSKELYYDFYRHHPNYQEIID